MHARELGRDVLPDDVLLARLAVQLKRNRRVEAELIALIAEVDARRLYLREACISMHAYVTGRLHLSDAEAYLRITVARLSRRFPIVLTMLADGRLHVSGIARLAPHLRDENGEAVLARAVHLSKREIEALVAELSPRPDASSLIRRLPGPPRAEEPLRAGSLVPGGAAASGVAVDGAGGSGAAAGGAEAGCVVAGGEPSGVSSGAVSGQTGSGYAEHGPAVALSGSPSPAPAAPVRMTGAETRRSSRPAAVIAPTAPGRYKVQFTAGDELREKIARAQGLLRHQVPDGDLAVIVDRAMTLLLRELERARFAATSSPRKSVEDVDPSPSSRFIPAPIRRAVWLRDGGRCTFLSPSGDRCSAMERLEFHHVVPFAHGGDHSEANVCLLCALHNAYQAELDFGAAYMAGRRGGAPVKASVTPDMAARRQRGTPVKASVTADMAARRRSETGAKGAATTPDLSTMPTEPGMSPPGSNDMAAFGRAPL